MFIRFVPLYVFLGFLLFRIFTLCDFVFLLCFRGLVCLQFIGFRYFRDNYMHVRVRFLDIWDDLPEGGWSYFFLRAFSLAVRGGLVFAAGVLI